MTKSICSIDGCEQLHHARGFCRNHWKHWKTHGDPLIVRSRWDSYQKPVCSVDGCGRESLARGLCGGHYRRSRYYNGINADVPLQLQRSRGLTPVETFRYFMPEQPPSEGCWLWTGSVHDFGYGTFMCQGVHVYAHRVSYELFIGPIPKGLLVRHRCDNPPCCQPAHLLPGTDADNVRDMDERGRRVAAGSRGSSNPGARLSEADVLHIRAMHADGQWDAADLSESFGITRKTVYSIVNRKTWRHI